MTLSSISLKQCH